MKDQLPALVIVVPLLAALLVPLFERVRRGSAWTVVTVALLFTGYAAVQLLLDVCGGPLEGRIRYALGDWAAPMPRRVNWHKKNISYRCGPGQKRYLKVRAVSLAGLMSPGEGGEASATSPLTAFLGGDDA